MGSIGTGENFTPENPTFREILASYILVLGIITPLITLFMYVLNNTRIIGKKNISGSKAPWILMSNHITIMDDLFLDPLIAFSNIFKGYRYIPHHAPEEHNFYKSALSAWFMKRVKSIPLIRGKGAQQEGMNRLIKAVRDGGTLHIYPEGTRSRSGKLGRGRSGVGRLVYEAEAPVIPVYHYGLGAILPIGHAFPRFGKKVRVSIGEPIYFDEELKMENDHRTWKLITNRIMEAIAEQQQRAEEKWGPEVSQNPTH